MKQLSILTIVLLFTAFCSAQTMNSNLRVHDGFFLSLGLGTYSSSIHIDENRSGLSSDYSGGGAAFDIKIGGVVYENLILHATITSKSVSSPEVEYGSVRYKAADNFVIGESLIGVGLTRYIMPTNIFLSGSIGIGRLSLTDTNSDESIASDAGFGMQLKIGKEWWVSRKWGFGVALSYSKTKLNNNPSYSIDEDINTNNVGIHFVVTLN